MTTGEPNKDKLVHFIAKIWDPVAEAYKPIYTAPDATDQTYGDVLLSDATDSELDASTGVTAATPKAVKLANDNANTKLSKTSTDPQEVAGKVTFKSEVVGEQNITAPTFTGDLKGNSDTTTKIKTPINLNTQSGALTPSGKVLFDGSTDVTIPLGQLDATQLRGIVPLENLPQGALERVVNYPSLQDAIDAYTAADDANKPFQEGDTIRVTGADGDLPIMYAVVGNPTAIKNYVEYAAATASNALSADQALKLTTDAGAPANPVYFKNGIPVALDTTLGNTNHPVYLKDGVFTPISDTVGSTKKPVYLNAGEITELSDSIGDTNTPIFLENGEIKQSDFTIKTSVPENAVFTDTTYDVFISGTEETPNGINGLVPAPTLVEASANDLYLKSDGTWAKVIGGVTGVKGNREAVFRTENVNLTHDNIGAVGLQLPISTHVPEPEYNWDKDYFWSRHVDNQDNLFFGVKLETGKESAIVLNNYDYTSGDVDTFKINGSIDISNAPKDIALQLSIKSNKNNTIDVSDLQVEEQLDTIDGLGIIKLSNSVITNDNTITLPLVLTIDNINEALESYTYNITNFLHNVFGLSFNDNAEAIFYLNQDNIPEGNDLNNIIQEEPIIVNNTSDEDSIQYMQGLDGQVDGPIRTTPGGLLPNGANSQLGNPNNLFKDVYSENIYADHVYISEDGLKDFTNGDFTVANANKLNQKIIFTGDVNQTVDLSTLGDKIVNIQVAPEIAIQAEEPVEESVKLWIKI